MGGHWQAPGRLCKRSPTRTARGTHATPVVVASARERLALLGAMAQTERFEGNHTHATTIQCSRIGNNEKIERLTPIRLPNGFVKHCRTLQSNPESCVSLRFPENT
jgi:hypothetical protein